MNTERNLLAGVLALQTGLINPGQFAESCREWATRSNEILEDRLIERGWISPDDGVHLSYLLRRTLKQHHGDARACLRALATVVRNSLAALQEIDTESTVRGAAAPIGAAPGAAPVAIAATDIPRDKRYVIQSLHAAGGIGRVWLALDQHLEREVAIKDLHPENTGNAKVTARFLREARLTARLEHPGIVPVYELSTRADTNEPFYTMRFVRGRTLTDALTLFHMKRNQGQSDPLEFASLLTAFAAVCNAIAYAHSRGVLHRDLKGDNVILGDYGEVIVLDWGLAKHLNHAEESPAPGPGWEPLQDPNLTVEGEVVGTPAYMSPEQAEGRLDQIDERTDIFGLGGILYAILTGRPPFVGANTLDVLFLATQCKPPPPRDIWPEVPLALEAIALKAMARNPSKRYASAAELAQEVQVWQDVQRRQAEEALRRQTQMLRSILDGMSEGVVGADADGNVIVTNPAAERLLSRTGIAPAPGAPLDASALPLERAIHGEEVDDTEFSIGAAGASAVAWISANARPLRDESGQIRGGVVVFRDITERHRAEAEREQLLAREREARAEAERAVCVLEEARAALHASEEQYRTLADLIPGCVWSSRPDGYIDYANQFWFSYTGLTLEQTVGEGWATQVHPEDLPRVQQLWRRALQTGMPVDVDYRVRSAGGEYRWFLAQSKPMRDREGRIVKWFGMLTEIEDQKRGARALERQNALEKLLRKVTVAAYEANTFEQALQAGIDHVCAYTGWPVGHVYVLAGEGSSEMVPTRIWHLDRPDDFKDLVRVTEATRLAYGAGLPGRVLAEQQPCWIMDVTRDDNFPRSRAAAGLGVKGAFGFPVLTPHGVVAVLEFFTSEPQEPDEILLAAMAQIGLQLGQVFERKRTRG